MTDLRRLLINTYVERTDTDPGARIVRLLDEKGKRLPHIYYRSDANVFTTAFEGEGIRITAYDGPIANIPAEMKEHFKDRRYEFAKEESELAFALKDISSLPEGLGPKIIFTDI